MIADRQRSGQVDALILPITPCILCGDWPRSESLVTDLAGIDHHPECTAPIRPRAPSDLHGDLARRWAAGWPELLALYEENAAALSGGRFIGVIDSYNNRAWFSAPALLPRWREVGRAPLPPARDHLLVIVASTYSTLVQVPKPRTAPPS